jgi:hypothetical protein
MTSSEIVTWYRERLRAQGSINRFDQRLLAAPEAAQAEAVVFHYLLVKNLQPSLLEDPTTGGLDYECFFGNTRFAVEVTALVSETVSEKSRFPNELKGPGNLDTSSIVSLVRSRISNKAPQARSYPGPRVLAITSTHVLASVLFSAGAEEFLTGEAGIAFQVGPKGPIDDPYMATELKNSAFVRPGAEGGMETYRPKHALVLFFAIHGSGAHVLGIVNPNPEHSLEIAPFRNVPFARLQWPAVDDTLRVEWFISGPRPEQHYFIHLSPNPSSAAV